MVSKDRITLIGDWTAWSDSVRQGRMVRANGEAVWVLLRSFPDFVIDDDSMAALRKQGRALAKLEHPAILPLLHITRVGGAPVWVHEGFQGVSLARILDVQSAENRFLPVRVACEMCREVTQGILAALTQGTQDGVNRVVHPGPDPAEILVDAIGNIKVAGFALVGEGEGIPAGARGYVPANPGSIEQASVYGVGALMAHAISGERPGPSHEEEHKQEAMLRRAAIRVLARPGEAIPDGLMDLIRACMNHDPDARPELTVLADALERITAQEGTGLRAWAPTTVPSLLQQQESGYPDADATKHRRHVEGEQPLEASFEAPPVREPVPREIATMVAKYPVPIPEDDGREVTPLVSSASLSIPTSETDVRLFQAEDQVPAGGGEVSGPIVTLELPVMEDTGEFTERGPTEGDVVGWPLAMGAMVGMVVAAAVGWVVVEQLIDQSPAPVAEERLVEPIEPIEPAVPAPVETAAVPEAASEAALSEAVLAEEVPPEAAKAPPAAAAAPPRSPTPAPVSAPPVTPAPKAKSKPAAPARVAPAPARFPVSFRAVDGAVDLMVVKCHEGKGQGRSEVHIPDAGRGPCRVIGFRGEEQLVVSVVLHGPQTFTCFAGGSRTCR